MGNCCIHKLTSNNINEKFITDVFNNLKIRKYNCDEIEEFYNEITSKEIIEDKGVFKELTFFSENNYNRILKTKFIESDFEKNPYYIIHLNIFPSYNDFLSEDPEFLFRNKTFPFNLSHDSLVVFKKIQTLSAIKNMNSNRLTFKEFFGFLKDYLSYCLIEIPTKIISSLESIIKTDGSNLSNLMENETIERGNITISDLKNFITYYRESHLHKNKETLYLGEYKIDKYFIDNMVIYLNPTNYSNKLGSFYNELIRKMKEILIDDDGLSDNDQIDEITIRKSDFQKFYNLFPWLWDIIDLIIYYVNNTTKAE